MYLSHLMIDVGDDPDRPRPGRLWLRDIYQVHQRLSMAFPSVQQRGNDPQFLRPFNPADFECPHFLFRIDNQVEDSDPSAIILVQSEIRPDWDYAFYNAGMLLAAPSEWKEYAPTFEVGDRFRFRIRVNLSKKIQKSKDGTDLQKHTVKDGRERTQSKRVSLTWSEGQDRDDVIREWFSDKAARNGFALDNFQLVHLGWVSGYRGKGRTPSGEDRPKHKMRFRSALIEGTLAVTDAQCFSQAVASGIGSAKAFGFGLLSLLPLR